MSLEQALKENTEAVKALTEALEHQSLPGFVKAAKAAQQAEAEEKEATPEKDETAKPEPKKRGPKPKAAAAPVPDKSIYDRLCDAVLQLADKDVEKTVATLAQFGVQKVSQLTPNLHEEALEAVTAALNGDDETEEGEQTSFV